MALMLILKWGGDLTKLGERQAERLGERFTQAMYPDPSGGGILRLHSTFRHDMKIKVREENSPTHPPTHPPTLVSLIQPTHPSRRQTRVG